MASELVERLPGQLALAEPPVEGGARRLDGVFGYRLVEPLDTTPSLKALTRSPRTSTRAAIARGTRMRWRLVLPGAKDVGLKECLGQSSQRWTLNTCVCSGPRGFGKHLPLEALAFVKGGSTPPPVGGGVVQGR